MTNQWYIHVDGDELGPISFKDLVDLVRAGVITEADLVRSFWKETNQRADSVVGLFYLSRQAPVEQVAPEGVLSPAVDCVAANDEPSGLDSMKRPEWLQRLLELHASQQEIAASRQAAAEGMTAATLSGGQELELPQISESEPDSSGQQFLDNSAGPDDHIVEVSPTSWAETMAAALSQVDSRGTAKKQREARNWVVIKRVRETFNSVFGASATLSNTFRIVCFVATASMVGVGVERWSSKELMRFPARSIQQQNQIRMFPWIGKCTYSEYTLLMMNLMLVSGVSAYGMACFLESRADE
ncbi:MAG: DUF4339 domain-containing protein [Planctomycetota bacterium]